jgi:autoinducer 2-degrading protein
MSKIALVVEFNIKVGQREAFLEIMRGHVAGTKQDEEGCLQFDILIPEDDDNKVMLVEMYLDNTALDIHIASPRLQKTRAAYGDMIESRNIAKTRIDDS